MSSFESAPFSLLPASPALVTSSSTWFAPKFTALYSYPMLPCCAGTASFSEPMVYPPLCTLECTVPVDAGTPYTQMWTATAQKEMLLVTEYMPPPSNLSIVYWNYWYAVKDMINLKLGTSLKSDQCEWAWRTLKKTA